MKKRTAVARRMARGRFLSHHGLFPRACRFCFLRCCLASQLLLSLTRERKFGKAASQANQDKPINPTPRAMNITNAQLPNQTPREITGTLATSKVRASKPMNVRFNTELSSFEGSRLDLCLCSETTSSRGRNSPTMFLCVNLGFGCLEAIGLEGE